MSISFRNEMTGLLHTNSASFTMNTLPVIRTGKVGFNINTKLK